MLRRTACGTLLCAMAALAGACGSATIPTTPTAPITTETFTGTLSPAGTAVHPFVTKSGGAVSMTLTALGPDATKTVGFSLGTYNQVLNVCSVVFDNPAALQGAVFTATASTIGIYCARVYDNGAVAAAGGSAAAFTYTVTVTHP